MAVRATLEERLYGMDRKKKDRRHTANFLIESFFVLLVISIGAFAALGFYMRKVSEEGISKVGDLYMTGIKDHITAHFRTLIGLKLEQLEAVVMVVPLNMNDKEKLREELVYRANVRNFSYLALCSEDGEIEMLDGEQIELADPEPFYDSLEKNEKKVAVGKDSSGNEVVIFGISADYPMEDGERSMALLAAVSIEYISTMLNTDEDNALIYSHIIRGDGTFVVSEMS